MDRTLNRRRLAGTAAAGAAMAAGGAWLPASVDAKENGGETRATAPNVVLVVLDDMDASCWEGLPWIRRQVRRMGTWYPNFIVNTPTCGPSRATLLTGQMAHNHRVIENSGEDGAWQEFQRSPALDNSLQAAAKAAGYYIGVVGKLMNGSPDSGSVGPHFDQWFVSNRKDYRDFNLNENGEKISYSSSDYTTSVLAQKAMSFIRNAPEERPFFLLLGLRAPKIPASPETRFRRRFGDVRVERTPAWNELDNTDKPEHVRRRPAISLERANTMDGVQRDRLRTMLSVDAAVKSVAHQAKVAQRSRETIFIVLTDNGYSLGTHRIEGKGLPYDVVVRCPMAAWGPGIPERRIDERLVAMADIAPTLGGLLGLGKLRPDGLSFLGPTQHEFVLIEKDAGSVAYAAVRSLDELYVEYNTGEREYYDYRVDPWEMDNQLADWEGHVPTLDPARAAELSSRVRKLRQCRDRRCYGVSR